MKATCVGYLPILTRSLPSGRIVASTEGGRSITLPYGLTALLWILSGIVVGRVWHAWGVRRSQRRAAEARARWTRLG